MRALLRDVAIERRTVPNDVQVLIAGAKRNFCARLNVIFMIAFIGLGLVSQSLTLAARADGTQQPWRGVVRAVHQAALSSDLALPVTRVSVRDGGRFKAGQLLVEFNCRRQHFELRALAALVREASIAVVTNQHLEARGASNRNDIEIAKARHDKTSAEWSALNERLAGCLITAPFDGVVVELSVNAFEVPPPSRPLMIIASDALLEIEFIVPSRVLGELGVDARIVFAIDETNLNYTARIVRTAGSVDPVSQMAKVHAVFDPPHAGVLPGMSGTASVRHRNP